MKQKTKLNFLLGLILFFLILATIGLHGIIKIDLWIIREVFVIPAIILTLVVFYEIIKTSRTE